jgi:hypothetical protein
MNKDKAASRKGGIYLWRWHLAKPRVLGVVGGEVGKVR